MRHHSISIPSRKQIVHLENEYLHVAIISNLFQPSTLIKPCFLTNTITVSVVCQSLQAFQSCHRRRVPDPLFMPSKQREVASGCGDLPPLQSSRYMSNGNRFAPFRGAHPFVTIPSDLPIKHGSQCSSTLDDGFATLVFGVINGAIGFPVDPLAKNPLEGFKENAYLFVTLFRSSFRHPDRVPWLE